MTYAMPGGLSAERGMRQRTGPSRGERGDHALRPAPHGTREVTEALQGTAQVPQEARARLQSSGPAPAAVGTGHGDPQPGRPTDAIDVAQELAYHVGMTVFRIAVLVLGVIHALFVGLTSLAGAFADGGGVWQRLLVVLLHPLGAAGVLVLLFVPRLTRTATLGIVAVLLANVIADLALAQRIAAGAVRGDWELALAFAVVPVIGMAYALSLLRSGRPTVG